MSRKDKPRRFSFARVLRDVLLLLVVATLAATAWLYTDYSRFRDAPLPLAVATIDVPRGASIAAIANLVDTRPSPIRSIYWRLLVRELGVAGKLHAGEYALTPELTPRGLLAKMAAGDVIQHHFTIVEGWTVYKLVSALWEDASIKKAPCMGEPLNPCIGRELMQQLGEPGLASEGQFLPETYSYVKGDTNMDILRRAHEAMRKTLEKLWGERSQDTPLKSSYEALTLASIVEKETGRAEERPRIAGVFLARLKLDMKLQTDPTVIYGKYYVNPASSTIPVDPVGLNITRNDLTADNPYNTYTRFGLPPTPIAMPGKAALEAVIHPAETNALYFVSRGDGSHQFSATLEAHNQAVAKYQLHRN